jgi:hypothetical protein
MIIHGCPGFGRGCPGFGQGSVLFESGAATGAGVKTDGKPSASIRALACGVLALGMEAVPELGLDSRCDLVVLGWPLM